jgi:hypothetical protein
MVKRVVKKKKVSGACSSGKSCGGCGYFLGFIGAVVYYVSTATSFLGGVLGIGKALVWPVFLVYEVLKFVGA